MRRRESLREPAKRLRRIGRPATANSAPSGVTNDSFLVLEKRSSFPTFTLASKALSRLWSMSSSSKRSSWSRDNPRTSPKPLSTRATADEFTHSPPYGLSRRRSPQHFFASESDGDFSSASDDEHEGAHSRIKRAGQQRKPGVGRPNPPPSHTSTRTADTRNPAHKYIQDLPALCIEDSYSSTSLESPVSPVSCIESPPPRPPRNPARLTQRTKGAQIQRRPATASGLLEGSSQRDMTHSATSTTSARFANAVRLSFPPNSFPAEIGSPSFSQLARSLAFLPLYLPFACAVLFRALTSTVSISRSTRNHPISRRQTGGF